MRRVLGYCLLILLCASSARGRVVGIVTTVAGTGEAGYSGDGGPAIRAMLDAPSGVGVDAKGNVYIGDAFNHRVRRVHAQTGVIETVAGDGYKDLYNNGRFFRDNWPATQVSLSFPTDIEIDPFGNLYVVDRYNYRVRRVDAETGTLTTVAGNGSREWTFSPDLVQATEVDLHSPTHIAIAVNGDLLISDAEDNRVRRVHLQSGVIYTLVGDKEQKSRGDGKSALRASLGNPGGIAVSAQGDVYVSDGVANAVRKIHAVTGIITTVVGVDISGVGPASETRVNGSEMAFDSRGNLHVVSGGRVRRVDAKTGVITVVAGGGNLQGAAAEGVPATAVRFSRATDITFDGEDNLYIAELGANRIRKVVFVELPDRRPDFDADGRVGFSDFVHLLRAFGTSEERFDLNWDGVVDGEDVGELARSFGSVFPAGAGF